MVLTLYKLDGSPPARTVLMLIDILKIPNVNYVNVNTLQGEQLKEEYVKMNPQHTIPTLKDDDFVIWDSHAIAVYLISTYGKDDYLYPKDPKKRALIDQRLHFDTGILFSAFRGAVIEVAIHGLKTLSDGLQRQFKSAYDFMEKFLTTPYLAGDNLTLADICCVSTISSLNEILPIDKEKYVNLTAWLQRCSQLDFYKAKNEEGLKIFGNWIKSKMQ